MFTCLSVEKLWDFFFFSETVLLVCFLLSTHLNAICLNLLPDMLMLISRYFNAFFFFFQFITFLVYFLLHKRKRRIGKKNKIKEPYFYFAVSFHIWSVYRPTHTHTHRNWHTHTHRDAHPIVNSNYSWRSWRKKWKQSTLSAWRRTTQSAQSWTNPHLQ